MRYVNKIMVTGEGNEKGDLTHAMRRNMFLPRRG